MVNLETYFARIGYPGPREPTLEVLQAICAGHARSIAFENIDPLLGRTPDLALPALQEKLLHQGRGGYCFEHNAMLANVLSTLGMTVTSLAARVVWMAPADAPPSPRTHMMLKVEVADVEGASFIADAGFGGQLLDAPLLLAPGLEQRTPMSLMRITCEDETYTAEVQLPQGWAPMYRFRLDAHRPVDYEPLNWFTAAHPSSLFRHNLLIQNLGPLGRANLLNDRLTIIPPEGAPEVRRIEDARDFKDVLERIFTIRLPVPAEEIFARVPKGLEGVFMPERGLR